MADDLIPADVAPMSVSNDPFETLLNPQRFDLLVRTSRAFADSTLVPSHFQGKAKDVFVVLQMALRLGVDPMTMLQSTYVVSGRPGMSATLVIALAARSGIFTGPITYATAGNGADMIVTATATVKETGEQVSETVSMKLATAEGWTRNKKYESMPGHMLKYRAATWLVRRYAPEVLLGLQTADELRDVSAARTAPRQARATATTEGPNRTATDISDQRRKAINAKIGELGLDRERVKAGMKVLFGVESTGDCDKLTGDEWKRVMDDLPGVAKAGEPPTTEDGTNG